MTKFVENIETYNGSKLTYHMAKVLVAHVIAANANTISDLSYFELSHALAKDKRQRQTKLHRIRTDHREPSFTDVHRNFDQMLMLIIVLFPLFHQAEVSRLRMLMLSKMQIAKPNCIYMPRLL